MVKLRQDFFYSSDQKLMLLFSCSVLTLRKGRENFLALAWVEKQPPWLLKPEVLINRIQVNFVLISLGFRKTLTCLIYEMWKSKAFTERVAPWLISCSGQFPVSQPEDRGICFAGIMTFISLCTVLVSGLVLWRDNMTKGTLVKENISLGVLLTVSEGQSLSIMAGSMTTCRQAWY